MLGQVESARRSREPPPPKLIALAFPARPSPPAPCRLLVIPACLALLVRRLLYDELIVRYRVQRDRLRHLLERGRLLCGQPIIPLRKKLMLLLYLLSLLKLLPLLLTGKILDARVALASALLVLVPVVTY